MRQTFSLLFFLKKRQNHMDDLHPIMVRITINGKSVEIYTGQKALLSNWSIRLHQCVGSCAKQTNLFLKSIRFRLNQIFYQQSLYGETTTPQKIKDTFTGADKKNHYLLSLFELHNESIRKQVGISKSPTTFRKYETTRKHLQGYLRSKCLEDIILENINHTFICDFEVYLRVTAHCAHNTTAKFMQFFKRIIILALNNGYITKNPFSEYQIKLQKVDRGYLTREELQRIKEKKIEIKRLVLVRDLFLFACYTGLSYIDLKNLSKHHLYIAHDGNLWLRMNRNKSGETANVYLFNLPKTLIAKYENPDSIYLFPVPSNQKVNAYLKEIADICDIHKNLTFHVARHTMATTVCLANGVPIESLSKVLGHTNIKTTQLYAKITDEKLSNDLAILMSKID